MQSKYEIARAVSLLRSMVRTEINSCMEAIGSGDSDRARKEVSEMGDKLKRVINVLNYLR